MRAPRTGFAYVHGIKPLEVPGAQHLAGLPVEQHQHVLHGVAIEILGEHQQVAVFHLELVVVVVARHPVFLDDLAGHGDFADTGGMVGHP